jgi:hypothetical protein
VGGERVSGDRWAGALGAALDVNGGAGAREAPARRWRGR